MLGGRGPREHAPGRRPPAQCATQMLAPLAWQRTLAAGDTPKAERIGPGRSARSQPRHRQPGGRPSAVWTGSAFPQPRSQTRRDVLPPKRSCWAAEQRGRSGKRRRPPAVASALLVRDDSTQVTFPRVRTAPENSSPRPRVSTETQMNRSCLTSPSTPSTSRHMIHGARETQALAAVEPGSVSPRRSWAPSPLPHHPATCSASEQKLEAPAAPTRASPSSSFVPSLSGANGNLFCSTIDLAWLWNQKRQTYILAHHR